MLMAEIKDAAGYVFCRIKGEDNFVRKSLSTKVDKARKNGLSVSLKTIPTVKKTTNAEAERLRKDEELTRWFLDWPTNRH